MAIRFLTLEEVMEIHNDQIEQYGGSLGVRDLRLLQSALAMPQAGIGGEYFHSDVSHMAAAYLFHIVRNHPFVDGNKRTGAMAGFTFLKVNGHVLEATEGAFERWILESACGRGSKDEMATFLRKHAKVRKLPSRRRRA